MDDFVLGRHSCRARHAAVGPDARSGTNHRFDHIWQFTWAFPAGVPVATGNSFRSADGHVCRFCGDTLDSFLHTLVMDVVRSHRRRNHISDWRSRKSCDQTSDSSSGISVSNEKKLELVRGLGPWSSAAIVIGSIIGTGIFLKPAEM